MNNECGLSNSKTNVESESNLNESVNPTDFGFAKHLNSDANSFVSVIVCECCA